MSKSVKYKKFGNSGYSVGKDSNGRTVYLRPKSKGGGRASAEEASNALRKSRSLSEKASESMFRHEGKYIPKWQKKAIERFYIVDPSASKVPRSELKDFINKVPQKQFEKIIQTVSNFEPESRWVAVIDEERVRYDRMRLKDLIQEARSKRAEWILDGQKVSEEEAVVELRNAANKRKKDWINDVKNNPDQQFYAAFIDLDIAQEESKWFVRINTKSDNKWDLI